MVESRPVGINRVVVGSPDSESGWSHSTRPFGGSVPRSWRASQKGPSRMVPSRQILSRVEGQAKRVEGQAEVIFPTWLFTSTYFDFPTTSFMWGQPRIWLADSPNTKPGPAAEPPRSFGPWNLFIPNLIQPVPPLSNANAS